jgi:DNA helicase HerA-like ATPase
MTQSDGHQPVHLGIVTGGSLGKGVQVKLDRATSVEDVAVGTYVAIQGQKRRVFGMITDVRLDALDPALLASPPDRSDPFVAEVLEGTAFYGALDVLPMLVLDKETAETRPVRTVPPHFAPVELASAEDVAHVFGSEDGMHLAIGKPLEMDVDVVLDLKAVSERSVGVFGKSGTGKTFLVRQLLAGLIKGRVAATLVFDMHNEYGWMGADHERGRQVKGLKQLFGSRVVVLTLDSDSSNRRGVPTDGDVRIGYGEIDPEDIEVLAETLNLTEAGRQLPYRLAREGGGRWLRDFLTLDSEGMKELVERLGENEATVQALRRRLDALRRFPFLSEDGGNRAVESIMNYLDRGFSVVLEFGRYGQQELAYILVANLLTRRIHENYVRRTERAMGEVAQQPQPLVIAIEEAHKFLSPALASQTIFGIIARELRKYGVTLLVVDQRPSGIDEEVLSQIGTKLACLLDNERDVDAVLSGVSGRNELRQVLARLESVQQALLFGHALPMPVVVRTREYGSPESYAAFSLADALESKEAWSKKVDDLFS